MKGNLDSDRYMLAFKEKGKGLDGVRKQSGNEKKF